MQHQLPLINHNLIDQSLAIATADAVADSPSSDRSLQLKAEDANGLAAGAHLGAFNPRGQ